MALEINTNSSAKHSSPIKTVTQAWNAQQRKYY